MAIKSEQPSYLEHQMDNAFQGTAKPETKPATESDTVKEALETVNDFLSYVNAMDSEGQPNIDRIKMFMSLHALDFRAALIAVYTNGGPCSEICAVGVDILVNMWFHAVDYIIRHEVSVRVYNLESDSESMLPLTQRDVFDRMRRAIREANYRASRNKQAAS